MSNPMMSNDLPKSHRSELNRRPLGLVEPVERLVSPLSPGVASENYIAATPKRAQTARTNGNKSVTQFARSEFNTACALCKGCGSMVYFVQQPSGRLMPIDVFVSGGQVPHVGRARRPDDVFGRVFAEGAGRDGLGVSHLATCPAAADFRRRS